MCIFANVAGGFSQCQVKKFSKGMYKMRMTVNNNNDLTKYILTPFTTVSRTANHFFCNYFFACGVMVKHVTGKLSEKLRVPAYYPVYEHGRLSPCRVIPGRNGVSRPPFNYSFSV